MTQTICSLHLVLPLVFAVGCAEPVEIADLVTSPDAGTDPGDGETDDVKDPGDAGVSTDAGPNPDSGPEPDAQPSPDAGTFPALGLPFAPKGGIHEVLAAEPGLLFALVGPSWFETRPLVSTDDGATYTWADLGAVDPDDVTAVDRLGDTVLAATHSGLLASDDGGLTFGPMATNIATDIVWRDLAVANGTIFAVLSTEFLGELHRSDDGGQTFVSTGMSATRVDADGDRVFVSAMAFENVAVSTDGGDTFTSTSLGSAVPPEGMLEHDGDIYAWNQQGLWRSSDEGSSYTMVTEQGVKAATVIDGRLVAAPGNFGTQLLELSPDGSELVPFSGPTGPGGHLVDVRTSGNALLLSHLIDGLWRWSPGDAEWTHASIGTAYPDVIGSDGDTIYATRSQGSVLYASDDEGETWDARAAGLAGVAGFGLRAFSVGDGALYGAGTAAGHQVLRSTDGGRSWAPLGTAPSGASSLAGEGINAVLEVDGALLIGLNGAWTGALDGHGQQTDSNPDGGGAFRSTNGGQSWVPVHGGLPQRVGSNGILAPASVKSFARMDDGRILARARGTHGEIAFSDDDGQTWSLAQLPSDLRDAPANELALAGTRVFTVTASSLYRSTDRGETFSAIDGGLPDVPFRRVAAASGLVIVINEDDEAWYSLDGGDSFEQIFGLPEGPIIGAHVADRKAYLAVVGSGVVTADFR